MPTDDILLFCARTYPLAINNVQCRSRGDIRLEGSGYRILWLFCGACHVNMYANKIYPSRSDIFGESVKVNQRIIAGTGSSVVLLCAPAACLDRSYGCLCFKWSFGGATVDGRRRLLAEEVDVEVF